MHKAVLFFLGALVVGTLVPLTLSHPWGLALAAAYTLALVGYTVFAYVTGYKAPEETMRITYAKLAFFAFIAGGALAFLGVQQTHLYDHLPFDPPPVLAMAASGVFGGLYTLAMLYRRRRTLSPSATV